VRAGGELLRRWVLLVLLLIFVSLPVLVEQDLYVIREVSADDAGYHYDDPCVSTGGDIGYMTAAGA